VGPYVRALSGVESLDEVLAGHLGVDAVRKVVLRPLDFGLAPLLDEQSPPGRHWHLRLVRSKYKPERMLTAYYTATTHCHAAEQRHLAVTWQAAATGLSPGSSRPGSHARVTAHVYPDDPSIPALERLSDGAYLASLAASLDGRVDHVTAPLRVRVLRYRPGHRHVLHAVAAGNPHGLVVKTDKHDASARAFRLARDHGPHLAQRCPFAGLVQPLGYSAGDRASLWHEAAGKPLWRVLTAPPSQDALFARVGIALRALHDTDVDAPNHAGHDGAALPRCRDADEHVALTLRAGEHISALLPDVGRVYDDLVHRLAERLEGLPGAHSTLAHGDLKCDHILVDRDRLCLIDLDRAGRGDPALDLGLLMADLRWWSPDQADWHAAALRAGYGRCEDARWRRAETLASLFLLRFAARRCAVYDPAWERKVRAGLAAALGSARKRGMA